MTTFKKGRSSVFTIGICNTFYDTDRKVLFFELDEPVTQEQINQVIDVYKQFDLNLMIHQTGNGMHFLSPTMIDKDVWKFSISHLNHLNRKCPMNTLRVTPNKYPNEEKLWFGKTVFNNYNHNDSFHMSNYLNVKFNTCFHGNSNLKENLKTVRYPLPLSEFCR